MAPHRGFYGVPQATGIVSILAGDIVAKRSNVEPFSGRSGSRGQPVDSSAFHALFVAVAGACARIDELDELLHDVVDAAGSALDVSRCMIGLYPPDAGSYTFQYVYRGPEAPDTGQLVMIGYDRNPSFQMLVRGEVYRCDDTANDPRFAALRHFYSAHRIGATLFTGLRRNDEWLGSLGVHQCDRPRPWSDAEVAILGLIADQVALAIDLIRYRERVEHQQESSAYQNRELKRLKALKDSMLSRSWSETGEGAVERDGAAVSDAEFRVLRLVSEGRTNAEIAGALNLSRRTVESHITSMLSKLDLRNRVELARFALRQEIE